MREPYDLSSQPGCGTQPVVRTTLTNPCRADPVVLLVVVSSYIVKFFALGTDVTVLFRLVTKMTLAKRLLLLVQGLSLRGNHHFDPLLIDLFKFDGIGIPRIRYCHFAGFKVVVPTQRQALHQE